MTSLDQLGGIENRKLREYGLPLRHAVGEDFWLGCLSGFLSFGGTLFAVLLVHGFRIARFALHGKVIVYAFAGWAIAFLMNYRENRYSVEKARPMQGAAV